MVKKFRLASHVKVGYYGEGGVFGIGSNQIVLDEKDKFEALVKVASVWLEFDSEESIRHKAKYEFKELNEETLLECISILKDGFLTTEINDFSERYSRNKLYFDMMGANSEEVQAKIINSKVTIIGCGGIGNYIAYMLASSGVAEITLIDDDVIELSNLTRQILFREKDCGLNKVDVLEREINAINSSVSVKKIKGMVLCEEDLISFEKSDLYIVSADMPSELILWINSFCVKNKQAYINIGYINDISVVGPMYIPGKTSCFACGNVVPNFFSNSEVIQKAMIDINKNYKSPSCAVTNGIASSYAFGDVIKYLGDFGEILSINKRIGIHTRSIKIEEQMIPKNKNCLCSKN